MTPEMREALEDLRDYIPERGVTLTDPPCQDCGWHQDEHHLGGSDHGFHPGPPDATPFFTEGYLYDLMGKEDARTILAIVRNILRAAGVTNLEMMYYL